MQSHAVHSVSNITECSDRIDAAIHSYAKYEIQKRWGPCRSLPVTLLRKMGRKIVCANKLLRPLFPFIVSWQPLVAVVIMTGAEHDARCQVGANFNGFTMLSTWWRRSSSPVAGTLQWVFLGVNCLVLQVWGHVVLSVALDKTLNWDNRMAKAS